jgi:hypothetical protein
MDTEVTCPITDEPAKQVRTTGDYTEFSCPTCGPFRISSDAYEAVTRSEDVLRRSALANAKLRVAEGNETPTIGYDDLSII